MKNPRYHSLNERKPKIMGIGLLTLDIILNGENIDIISKIAGGSMCNVITILSFFGWNAYPIAYIGNDKASKIILNDIVKWNVNMNFVYLNDKVSSPIIIEKIHNGTKNTHEFNFKCPLCNSKLPRNRTIPSDIALEIIEKMPKVNVFYLDRLSRSAVSIAKIQKENGAIIYFEPHKISKMSLFKEMIKITDILKYSGDNISEVPFSTNAFLEIKSLGENGVEFLFKKENKKIVRRKIPGYNNNHIRDTAGAGDWLSAGIIFKIGQYDEKERNNLTQKDIIDAINFGQSLALLNCNFIGARGMMYNLDKFKIMELSNEVINNKHLKHQIKNNKEHHYKLIDNLICPNCD